jgi:outer membrane biosynthesis protein TonB
LLAAIASYVGANYADGATRQLSDVGKIVGFRLINADTNRPIMNITNTTVLQLPLTDAKNINIDVVTDSSSIGSVMFGYLGVVSYRVESFPPFAVCGDDFRNADYFICPTLKVGKYVVTATPFSDRFASGTKGQQVRLEFSVVDSLTNSPSRAPSNSPRKPPTNTPRKPPTYAPRKPPTNTPIKPPTNAPRRPPTSSPRKLPTNTPRKPPTNAPRKPPTNAPRKPPTNTPRNPSTYAPTYAPTKPPTYAPRMSPTNIPVTELCEIPKVRYTIFILLFQFAIVNADKKCF